MSKSIDFLKASLRDIGVVIADSFDNLKDAASALFARMGTADENHEVYNDLWAAVSDRKMQKMATRHYEKTDHDTYVELPKAPKPDALPERYFELTPAFCLRMTGNEFGKLKGEQPNLHGMVGAYRKAHSTYMSKVQGRFGRYLKEAANGDETARRAPSKAWHDKVEEYLLNLPKTAEAALKRGDASAPVSKEKLQKAIAAFWAALK